jgi:N-acyl-D-amino-acid deacylase
MIMKKIFLYLNILFFSLPAHAQLYSLIIRNGKIIDGTGNAWRYADIGINNDRIEKIGNLKHASALKIIDASGLIVAPGFIDVHTHIEDDEMKNPTADNFIYDGVTSVITGNCGLSHVDIGAYLKQLDSLHTSVNVATLVGHNDIRKAVMGTANRKPTEQEMQQMEKLVDKAMKEGAVGFSTGLIYIPGTYASSEEVERLATITALYDGVYATHMRNESDSVMEAIAEALRVAEATHVSLEISHFKVGGQQNWGKSKQTLAMIEEARKKGVDVTIDQYPYTASSTGLSTLLPDDILSDGADSIKARLRRPEVKNYVIGYMLNKLKQRKRKHYDYAVVAYYKADTTLNGKSMEQINLLKGRKHTAKAEAETVIDMMIENGGAAMVFHGMSEADVQYIMKYPQNMFASDASIRIFNEGNPHPRGYGTNARILGKYVREEKLITLEEAIRRMTSLPATKFHLKNRGMLAEGYAADIVIFDEQKVKDLSSFEKPHAYSTGFLFVIVNGRMVVENGKHIGTRSGQVLFGPGHQR